MTDIFAAILGTLVLCFLFDGDPDAWDKLHAFVMHLDACK